jgi:uncharacterized membrane protein YkoI
MRRVLQLLSVCLLAVTMSCVAQAKEKEENEEKEAAEVKVPFTQVPPAVQTTLKEEARGATITEVDKEDDDGKTVYEADVDIKGRNYEIKVAPDGTLISKKLDEEKEGDEKDEKGEKDEKK